MSRIFTRTPTVRPVILAPQTTAGNERAFDMRPKVTNGPRYETRGHVARETQAMLLDELKA